MSLVTTVVYEIACDADGCDKSAQDQAYGYATSPGEAESDALDLGWVKVLDGHVCRHHKNDMQR